MSKTKESLSAAIAACQPFGPSKPGARRKRLRASLLRDVLIEGPAERRARLHLRNCEISGELDLAGLTIAPRLHFESCVFEGPIELEQARVQDLEVIDCELLEDLNGHHLEVEWDLLIVETKLKRLSLRNSRVGGSLSLAHSEFEGAHESDGAAIDAQQIEVGGLMTCDEAEVRGEFSMPGARVHGPLSLEGMKIEAASRKEVRNFHADSAEINGFVHADRLQSDAEVRLCGVKVGGQFTIRHAKISGGLMMIGAAIGADALFEDAELKNRDGMALRAETLKVIGSLALTGEFSAEGDLGLAASSIGGALTLRGEVTGRMVLLGANIAGQLQLREAVLTNAHGLALVANALSAEGGLIASGSLTVSGGIALRNARFGGPFRVENVTLTSRKGPALQADGISVEGPMFWLGDCRVSGEMRLAGASITEALAIAALRLERGGLLLRDAVIGADLLLGGSKLLNEDGSSLNAARVKVSGSLMTGEGFESGEMVFVGSHFGAFSVKGAILSASGHQKTALNCDGMVVEGNFNGDELSTEGAVKVGGVTVGGQMAFRGATLRNPLGPALSAERIEAAHGVYLEKGFDATGEVRLDGARIHNQLCIIDARLEGGRQDALSLRLARVDELVLLPERIAGPVDLREVEAQSLRDVHRGELLGIAEGQMRMDGFSYRTLQEPLDAKRRKAWIECSQQDRFYPGVYSELVAALRRIGHNRDARRVSYYRERQAHQQLGRFNPMRAWYEFLRLTIGYGYYNALALVWLIALIVVGGLLFGSHEGDFTNLVKEPPDLEVWLYSIDATVPILDIGQQHAWAAEGCMAWLSTGLSIAGYALVSAVIAASAGLLNRGQE
jgi:hypothetical protein